MTYEEWLKTYGVQESHDYNTHDAYMTGIVPDERGHLPDTYKLPNHITYSDGSVYANKPDAPEPGRWRKGAGDKWIFLASPQNIKNAGGIENLKKYFQEKEPDSSLMLPGSFDAIRSLFRGED